VQNGRIEEAMDLHKSRCDEIGKERMDPGTILGFAEILVNNHEYSRLLTILEEYLEAIEISWGNLEQCQAYGLFARLYCGNNDFTKSHVYFERQLSIAKEIKDVELEACALDGLGQNYIRIGDYGKAMECLDQALVIQSERGDDKKGIAYCAMGDVLVAQEGREKEGILMFQKCVWLFEEANASEEFIRISLKLGNAYTKIGAWDDAITSLEKCLSIADSIEDERITNQLRADARQSLGKTYIEKYESLPERNDELIRKALSWSEKAVECLDCVNLDLLLDLAQEQSFLSDTEKAHVALKTYLDGSVQLGPSYCQSCHQTCAKDAIMEKCSGCKVARYCSYAHSIQA